MSDTPRTDAQPWVTRSNGVTTAVSAAFARELERELATCLANYAKLSEALTRANQCIYVAVQSFPELSGRIAEQKP